MPLRTLSLALIAVLAAPSQDRSVRAAGAGRRIALVIGNRV